jgi:hypothetical protein
MSIHICSKCGHEEHIFGQWRRRAMCKDYDVEFLGSLPLELAIREMADGGKPTVVGAPDSRTAEIYRGIARRVAVKVAEKSQGYDLEVPEYRGSEHLKFSPNPYTKAGKIPPLFFVARMRKNGHQIR